MNIWSLVDLWWCNWKLGCVVNVHLSLTSIEPQKNHKQFKENVNEHHKDQLTFRVRNQV
jgi:hypothetical protein